MPDFYQGCELWDFSMVDPDNRRAVDYDLRNQLLGDIRKRFCGSPKNFIAEILNFKTDGRMKLFLIWKALAARNNHSEVFQKGDYKSLEVKGRYKKKSMIVIVPRFLSEIITKNQLPIGEVWEDTCVVEGIRPKQWINCITNQKRQFENKIQLSDALADFPVALLMG